METELGEQAMVLVAVITVIVQQCKRVPSLVALKDRFPVFAIVAVVCGIAGAHYRNIENPIIAGIMIGMMAAGVYSTAKLPKPTKPEP